MLASISSASRPKTHLKCRKWKRQYLNIMLTPFTSCSSRRAVQFWGINQIQKLSFQLKEHTRQWLHHASNLIINSTSDRLVSTRLECHLLIKMNLVQNCHFQIHFGRKNRSQHQLNSVLIIMVFRSLLGTKLMMKSSVSRSVSTWFCRVKNYLQLTQSLLVNRCNLRMTFHVFCSK